MTHLRILHFGYQCPWLVWAIEQTLRAAEQLSSTIDILDVTHHPDLASRYRLFFPFMVLIDDKFRLPSPTPAWELVQIAKGVLAAPRSAPVIPRPQARADKFLPLTIQNIAETCSLCMPPYEAQGCQTKISWAIDMSSRIPDGILGITAYQGDQIVGVAEFLPAPVIPYPLPEKSPQTAFITCLYGADDGPDYRGHVLEHLIQNVREFGYQELQVIAGVQMPYPNGPESFFLQYGFERVVELDRVTLSEGKDQLVLLRQKL
jgi:hypothetical protein